VKTTYKIVSSLDSSEFTARLNEACSEGWSPSTCANAYSIVQTSAGSKYTVLVVKQEEA